MRFQPLMLLLGTKVLAEANSKRRVLEMIYILLIVASVTTLQTVQGQETNDEKPATTQQPAGKQAPVVGESTNLSERELRLAEIVTKAVQERPTQDKKKSSIWTTLIPIFTFIGGFLLSYVEKFRDELRKRKNLRFILFTEAKENYRWLLRILDDEKKLDPVAHAHLVLQTSSKLSHSVYAEYFGRLDTLRPRLLEVVIDCYTGLKEHQEQCEEFRKIVQTRPTNDTERSMWAAQATGMTAYIESATSKWESLLKNFEHGNEFINHIASEKGEQIRRFTETLELLNAQRNQHGSTEGT